MKPEDRGGREAVERWKAREAGVTAAGGGESGDGGGWEVSSICTVTAGQPEYADPTTGGVETTAIEGRSGVDPPPLRR